MGSVSLAGRSVLIVEDGPLIALELRRIIESAGAHVFAAPRLQHALRLTDHPDLSAAVLDYRVGDDDTAAVCERLDERGIPFFFFTGYNHVAERWPTTVVVPKPAGEAQILAALENALTRPFIGSPPKTPPERASA